MYKNCQFTIKMCCILCCKRFFSCVLRTLANNNTSTTDILNIHNQKLVFYIKMMSHDCVTKITLRHQNCHKRKNVIHASPKTIKMEKFKICE